MDLKLLYNMYQDVFDSLNDLCHSNNIEILFSIKRENRFILKGRDR